ncbi:MAG: hypothetical protein GKR94_16365 [Gammaproteobacteria bacterium]|nr:hypothetical protein [Gammaproteobacteria bacterium]
MPKLDKLKEELGWLKVVFGVLIAIDISLVGWLVQNFSDANAVLLIIVFIIVIMLTVAIVLTNRRAYRKIDEIGEL